MLPSSDDIMPGCVLVPLDGSAFSARALPMAAALAAHRGATLHLISVHVPLAVPLALPGAPVYDGRFDDARRSALAGALERVAARLREECGLTATMEVLDGEPADVLAGEVARREADLIVMTTHGRGGFARAWLGSVADALIRRASVPILLIRPTDADIARVGNPVDPADMPVCPEAELYPFRRVLVPLDGSPLAEEIVGPALELGVQGQTTYLLQRVVPVPQTMLPPEETFWTAREKAAQQEARLEAEQYLGRWTARLRDDGYEAEAVVVDGHDPARAILREADARRVDLIALSTNAREGLARLRLGSVADKLVRGASCPTLVAGPRGPLSGGAGEQHR